MNLYTFYADVPEMNAVDELRNLALWRRHHRALGFEPVVLGPIHAQRHPYFETFFNAVTRLPSINPKEYDAWCFVRWLAMAQVARSWGIMMDYDTYLYGADGGAMDMLPVIWNPTGVDMNKPICCYQGCVPCLVAGSAKAFLSQCERFAIYQRPAGTSHVSDMTILEQQAIADQSKPAEQRSFRSYSFVKCYGEDGWERAPAVHYNNGSMTPAGKQPRWKTIPSLRKI